MLRYILYTFPFAHSQLLRELPMSTHKKPAHDAGKLLGNKKTSKPVKKVAASDLAQTPKKPKK
jgi:hypothetical protein